MESKYLSAPFIGIKRHKLNTDGNGVATLVGFHGCPLNCKYCLNPQTKSSDGIWNRMTTKQLYDFVKVDDIYFQATKGGITFGGGEVVLCPDFIKEFRRLCGDRWRITLETSLNFDRTSLETLCSVLNAFIIDNKDFNKKIYKEYTGKDNGQVLENLRYLSTKEFGKAVKFIIPSIPEFNTDDDLIYSADYLEEVGSSKHYNDVYLREYETAPQSQ